MKNIILTFVLLSLVATAQAQITKAEVIATGLTCSMCSKATLNQLNSLTEVDSISTDLNTTTFILYFKKDSKVDLSDIKKKVEDAGFAIGSLVFTINLSNQKAENNLKFTQDNITYTFIETQPKDLAGEVKLQVLDKGFITEKEFKRIAKSAGKYPTYVAVNNEKLYHIKAL